MWRYLIKNNANRHFGALLHALVSTNIQIVSGRSLLIYSDRLILMIPQYTRSTYFCYILICWWSWFDLKWVIPFRNMLLRIFLFFLSNFFPLLISISIQSQKYADDEDDGDEIKSKIFLWFIFFPRYYYSIINSKTSSYSI